MIGRASRTGGAVFDRFPHKRFPKAVVPLVYVILCLIWSSTWLFIKIAIEDVPPVTAAAARFWIAGAAYLVIHLVRRIDFPKDWTTRLTIIGLGWPQIGISYAIVYWAEKHISSGMTAVLFATFPFVVAAVSARVIPTEGWTGGKLVGLICGALGVTLVFVDQLGIGDDPYASVAVVGVIVAAACCGVSIVYIKKYCSQCDTVALTALQMLGGAICLSAVALSVERPLQAAWTRNAVLATLYLALVGSAAAFFGFYWLLKRIEGTTVATITFVTPPLAMVLGWLVLDESITVALLAGTALVLTGVWFVARSRPVRTSATATSAAPADAP